MVATSLGFVISPRTTVARHMDVTGRHVGITELKGVTLSEEAGYISDIHESRRGV